LVEMLFESIRCIVQFSADTFHPTHAFLIAEFPSCGPTMRLPACTAWGSHILLDRVLVAARQWLHATWWMHANGRTHMQGHMTTGEAEQEMLEAGTASLSPVAKKRKRKAAAPNPLSVKRKAPKSEQQPGSTNRRKRRQDRAQDTGT
jgi:hypothetical protein